MIVDCDSQEVKSNAATPLLRQKQVFLRIPSECCTACSHLHKNKQKSNRIVMKWGGCLRSGRGQLRETRSTASHQQIHPTQTECRRCMSDGVLIQFVCQLYKFMAIQVEVYQRFACMVFGNSPHFSNEDHMKLDFPTSLSMQVGNKHSVVITP